MDEDKETNGAQLRRQMTTISVTPEQYERLFFQPTPARGDLSKRFGNPTLLGLLGFLVPFQTTMFGLMGWGGASPASLVSIDGSYYMFGGLSMVIAGICEFILGNTFPFAVFTTYGAHFCQVGFANDPAHNIVGAYNSTGGTLSMTYNSGSAFYNITMMLVSLVFLIGSVRTNAFFVAIFFFLVLCFALFAAADFYVGYHPTPEGVAYAYYLLQIGGGLGFIAALSGWYLAIVTACAATDVPCPLPILDMSNLFAAKTAANKRSGADEGSVSAQAERTRDYQSQA